jgi:hypothetical protein
MSEVDKQNLDSVTNTIQNKQDKIPAGTVGYLVGYSGTQGLFGQVDPTNWQRTRVPAGTTDYLLTASGTAGTFGTPRNPADFANFNAPGAADFNTLTNPGMYYVTGNINAPNSFASAWFVIVSANGNGNATRAFQIARYYNSSDGDRIYHRYLLSGNWSVWRQIKQTLDYVAGETLTGDTWFGKPIYRRNLDSTFPSTASTNTWVPTAVTTGVADEIVAFGGNWQPDISKSIMIPVNSTIDGVGGVYDLVGITAKSFFYINSGVTGVYLYTYSNMARVGGKVRVWVEYTRA